MGEDPRLYVSRELGEEIVKYIVTSISEVVRRLLEETGPPEKSRFLRALKIQTETLAIARSMGEERCSVLRVPEYEGLSTIFGMEDTLRQ